MNANHRRKKAETAREARIRKLIQNYEAAYVIGAISDILLHNFKTTIKEPRPFQTTEGFTAWLSQHEFFIEGQLSGKHESSGTAAGGTQSTQAGSATGVGASGLPSIAGKLIA